MRRTHDDCRDFRSGREDGYARCDRLKDSPEYRILYVEPVAAGEEALKKRGVTPTSMDEAAKTADVLIMAINDRAMAKVTGQVVPLMKKGAMLFMLDPAAAYADVLPKRADISIFVTHPSHPPLYNDETTEEARKDYFGGGFAKQAIVSALAQGPEEHYAIGEAISRRFFGPILRSHRITVEQMAMLEPATVETCTATFILACREALEEAIKARGARTGGQGLCDGAHQHSVGPDLRSAQLADVGRGATDVEGWDAADLQA